MIEIIKTMMMWLGISATAMLIIKSIISFVQWIKEVNETIKQEFDINYLIGELSEIRLCYHTLEKQHRSDVFGMSTRIALLEKENKKKKRKKKQ